MEEEEEEEGRTEPLPSPDPGMDLLNPPPQDCPGL